MKFVDLNKRNNPNKLNIIALLFVMIAIAGVFFTVNNTGEKKAEEQRVEKLKKIASDTTIKNINVEYKESDPGKFVNKNMAKTSQYTQSFYKMIISVSIMFVLFFLVVYILKKRNNLPMGGSEKIKIINKKYIGPKQYLATVVVEDEKLLLGITDHSINLLKTLKYDGNSENSSSDESNNEDGINFPKILGKIRKESNEIK